MSFYNQDDMLVPDNNMDTENRVNESEKNIVQEQEQQLSQLQQQNVVIDTTTSITDDDGEDYHHKRCHVIGLLVFSALYTFLYGGGFYGWGPMQLLLEDNGSFSWKCNNSCDDGVCSGQTASLLRIQFVAVLTVLVAPLIGYMLDKYHAVYVMILSIVLLFIAFISLGVAVKYPSESIDPVMYLSFISLGIVAQITAILTIETGVVLYPNDVINCSRVISVLNALFDAGGITYLGLWALSNSFNLSLTIIIIIYAVMAVICFGGGLYYWIVLASIIPTNCNSDSMDHDKIDAVIDDDDVLNDNVIDSSSEKKKNETSNHSSDGTLTLLTNDTNQEKQKSQDFIMDCNSDEKKNLLLTTIEQPSPSEINDSDMPGNEMDYQNNKTNKTDHVMTYEISHIRDNNVLLRSTDTNTTDPVVSSAYVKIANRRPYYKQMISEPFILLTIFFALHLLNNYYTLTATRDFLAYLGDDEYDNKYLTIFTFLLPASIVALPFVDYVLRYYGYHVGFQIINILALAQNCVRLFSSNLNVQIIGFILFSFSRCFLFSITLSYLPILVHTTISGKCVGIMFFASGIVSFVNFPLIYLAIEKNDGNFFQSNLIVTLTILPCFLIAYRIGSYIYKEQQHVS